VVDGGLLYFVADRTHLLRESEIRSSDVKSERRAMYEVFDKFMDWDTWYKNHPNDDMRFYLTLDKVVWSDDFSPDKMAQNMRARCNIPSNDITSGFAQSIDRLRGNAWAVKDFIKYTQLSKKLTRV
jgi:hypothetical protein